MTEEDDIIFLDNEAKNTKKLDKEVVYLERFAKSKIIKDDNKYIFSFNDNEYEFQLFSSLNLQKCDIKILKSHKKTEKYFFYRTLKLACSMDLTNPRVVIGKVIDSYVDLIILCKEKGEEKVLDYRRNLIMTKDDYYKIFNFREFNIVTKPELLNIYNIINATTKNYSNIFKYLLFTKKVFKELSKDDKFKLLTEKYDENGINRNNCILFGDNSDNIFFSPFDFKGSRYDKLTSEIEDFTENPNKKKRHIKKRKGYYLLIKRKFKPIKFDLLSNVLKSDNKEIEDKDKEKLLAEKRYGFCHDISFELAFSLESNSEIYLVAGKVKINENDYLFHSWIEIDGDVIDFTKNLMMKKKDYYKLYEVKILEKNKREKLPELCDLIAIFSENFYPMDINYFGKELYNDLKKNEKILKKELI